MKLVIIISLYTYKTTMTTYNFNNSYEFSNSFVLIYNTTTVSQVTTILYKLMFAVGLHYFT